MTVTMMPVLIVIHLAILSTSTIMASAQVEINMIPKSLKIEKIFITSNSKVTTLHKSLEETQILGPLLMMNQL
jgi:hypothetical protein